MENIPELSDEPIDHAQILHDRIVRLKKVLAEVSYITNYPDRAEGLGIRSLKISRHYYNYGDLKYSITSRIGLCGRWLQRAGFAFDQRVKIIAVKGLLVIVPEAEGPDMPSWVMDDTTPTR